MKFSQLLRVQSVATIALGLLATSTLRAQPVGQSLPYSLSSGRLQNTSTEFETVFSDVIHVEGAAWIRLFFTDVHLPAGSKIRVMSLADGAVQELDSDGLRAWSNASAFFNGDDVAVDLIAAPAASDVMLSINSVRVQLHDRGGGTADMGCGICGSDDRIPSSEPWVGRLVDLNICTASIINIKADLVSAGHCVETSNQIVEFGVPASNSDGTIQHPLPEFQFPILHSDKGESPGGGDWAVMTTGISDGKNAFEKMQSWRQLGCQPAVVGDAIGVWGFGHNDIGTRNYTQQYSPGGTIAAVGSRVYEFSSDIRGGNSGSAIVKDGRVLGVVTNCNACSDPLHADNSGTRIESNWFAAALGFGKEVKETAVLIANDGTANDLFGLAAISGDYAVSGAWNDNPPVGSAYFYKYSTGSKTWNQLVKRTPPGGTGVQNFGLTSMDGGVAAVAADWSTVAAKSGAGAVFLYARDQGGTDNWGQLKKLVALDPAQGARFGQSVELRGDTVVIGAGGGGDPTLSGAAYVFRQSKGGPNNWGQVKKLVPPGSHLGDNFGTQVSTNSAGTLVAVSSDRYYNNGSMDGAVFLFARDQGGPDQWGWIKTIPPPVLGVDQSFGQGLSLDADRVAVGAYLNDTAGTNAGIIYLYERNRGGENNWGKTTSVIANTRSASGLYAFGVRTQLRGDSLIAPNYESVCGGPADIGAIYFFQRNRGGADHWGQVSRFQAPGAQVGDAIGAGIGLSGTLAIAGDLLAGPSDIGDAHIFTLAGGCYADCTGDEAVDFFDYLCFQAAFNNGDTYADCDGSGVVEFADYLCFQNAYNAGCP